MMKLYRFLGFFIILFCSIATANAQKTKAQLSSEISSTFPDNITGAITPSGVRAYENDVINSIMPTAPVTAGNQACFNGTTGLLQDCGFAPNKLIVGSSIISLGTSNGVLFNSAGILGNTNSLAGAVLGTDASANPSLTNAPVLGVPGSSVGSIAFANATSGTVMVQPATGALGSAVASLPAGTYNIVGDSTTQTLSNKTFVAPVLGAATATSINALSISNNGGGGLSIANGTTLTSNVSVTLGGTASSLTLQGTGTVVNRDSTDTLTNKTFDTAGAGNVFKINGTQITANTGSGSNVLATSPTITTPTIGTSLTFSPTTGGIVGTTTNDNTAAGDVGEFVSSVIGAGSAISLTNATPANVTSISLTAGDWDVWGNVGYIPAATTNTTTYITAINTTSATLPGTSAPDKQNFISYPNVGQVIASGNHIFSPTIQTRVSIASTTTYFLIGRADFTVSTQTGYGYLMARRRR